MIKKLLFLIFLLFMAAASAGAILVLAWRARWSPLWALVGPAVFLGLPLLWILVRLLGGFSARKSFSRKAGIRRGAPPPARTKAFSVLRQEWERGAFSMRPRERNAREGKGARPLFLVAGPEGSGMTAALRESGLVLSSVDLPGSAARGEGCDWYFFEKAVYVAVHGLYGRLGEAGPGGREALSGAAGSPAAAGGGNGGGAPFDWDADPEREREVLLELLSETDRRVPLQGVLVALPASLLRPEREPELKDLGLKTWSLLNRVAADLDFSPPVYVLVTLLDEDRGWAEAMERLERGGAPAGAMAGKAGRRETGAETGERAAEAVEGEFLGLLDDLLEEDPSVIGPCLTAFFEAGSLKRPLSVFCGALASPSPTSPPNRIQGVFAARIPRERKQAAGVWREDGAFDADGPVPSAASLSPAFAASPPPAPSGGQGLGGGFGPGQGLSAGSGIGSGPGSGIGGGIGSGTGGGPGSGIGGGIGSGTGGGAGLGAAGAIGFGAVLGAGSGAGARAGGAGIPQGPGSRAGGRVGAGMRGAEARGNAGFGLGGAASVGGPAGARPASKPRAASAKGTSDIRDGLQGARLPELSGGGAGGAPGLRELFGNILPGGADLSRPLNLAWGRRQKGYLKFLCVFYAALMAAAVLAGLNVRYQKGMAEAVSSALFGESVDTRFPRGSLARAGVSWRLLARVEAFKREGGIRGIGPDRTEEFRSYLSDSFEMHFEMAMEDLADALNAQLDRALGPDPPKGPLAAAGGLPPGPGSGPAGAYAAASPAASGAPGSGRSRRGRDRASREEREAALKAEEEAREKNRELFDVTFRQLVWLYTVYGLMDAGEVDLGGSFPLLPTGFEGETAPMWNLALPRILGYYLVGADGVRVGSRHADYILGQLALATGRLAEAQGEEGLGWVTEWCASLPELQAENLVDFWKPYDPNIDEKYLAEGSPVEVPRQYTRDGRLKILEAASLLRDANAVAASAVAGASASPRDRRAAAALARSAAGVPAYLAAYEREYLEAWHAYKWSFEDMVTELYRRVSREELENQHNVAGVSPFTLFAETLYDNLIEFAQRDGAEPWLLNVALDRALSLWSVSKKQGAVHGILEGLDSDAVAGRPYSSSSSGADGRSGNGDLGARPDGEGADGDDGGERDAPGSVRTSRGGLVYRTDFMEKVYAAEAGYARYMDFADVILADLRLKPDDLLRLAARFFGGPSGSLRGVAGAQQASGAGAGKPGAAALARGAVATLSGAPAPRAAAPSSESSRYRSSRDAVSNFGALLYQEPGGGPPDDLYYNVRAAQLDAVERLLVDYAAAVLDGRWESEVVHPLRFMEAADARQALYGP
ncbi:MAG: hypothetical protein LBQ12_01905, partial [Deltaproteobacteria bacterium]|nr:hypothetical protein [Deltaproteobacteria bacterium]